MTATATVTAARATDTTSQATAARDRCRGCLLGLAVGDALGATVEFQPRHSFPPLTDMVGGGIFALAPGQWTDDTSMALCLAASLVACRGFDAADQMQRYWAWYQEGYFSSTGRCFDIGNATRQALHRYHTTGDPFSGSTDPYSAGNGSLMRLAPVPIFYFADPIAVLHYAAESSRTTHAAAECLDACRLFAAILWRGLAGQEKEQVLFGGDPTLFAAPAIQAIARGAYRAKAEAEIQGSGYVVKSLEAALWCFLNTDSFAAAVLTAANLGDDADTTAAICGQVAGAYYGAAAIPPRWLGLLARRETIVALADELLRG